MHRTVILCCAALLATGLPLFGDVFELRDSTSIMGTVVDYAPGYLEVAPAGEASFIILPRYSIIGIRGADGLSIPIDRYAYRPAALQDRPGDPGIEHIFGLGLGLPFGGALGINYELGVAGYFSLTAGVGSLPKNTGYNFGVLFYALDREYRLRPRVTLLYGTNAVFQKGDEYEVRVGPSAGAGIGLRLSGHWSLGIDIFYMYIEKKPGYEMDGPPVGYSLGVHLRI